MLEVCVDSVRSAVEAQEGGAGRVELCANLIIGGTSPGASLFRLIRQYTDLEVRVLLRPRFGDFCYDEYEFEQMKEDAARYRDLGADAIVTGILMPDGRLDVERMSELAEAARGTDMTLHRAFDVCKDPFETLEQAIALGMKTILTSGQKNSAWEGRDLIRELVKRSEGRMEILAGAGISPEIIEKLAPYTGATAYHMSGKVTKESRMTFRRDGVSMGFPGFSEYEIWQTDAENIRRAKAALERIKSAGKKKSL